MTSYDSISTRKQALRAGNDAGREWAAESDREVFNDLRDRADMWGEALSSEKYAEKLAEYDSPAGGESAGVVGGVPERWAPLFDEALERAYRKAIRARVAEIEAE
jgi:hypothetical protein